MTDRQKLYNAEARKLLVHLRTHTRDAKLLEAYAILQNLLLLCSGIGVRNCIKLREDIMSTANALRGEYPVDRDGIETIFFGGE